MTRLEWLELNDKDFEPDPYDANTLMVNFCDGDAVESWMVGLDIAMSDFRGWVVCTADTLVDPETGVPL